jgi:hypothetical protein
MNPYQSDPDREIRLIEDLKSDNESDVQRAIIALSKMKSSWAIQQLSRLLSGDNISLAKAASSGLREIPGINSADALARGLDSPHMDIQVWCLYLIGEMALFGRRNDSLKVVERIGDFVYEKHFRVAHEAVHTLGKIGGSYAMKTLIEVLQSESIPPELKIYALHAPHFWTESELESFVKSAAPVISTFTEGEIDMLKKQSLFHLIPSEIANLIEAANHSKSLSSLKINTKKFLAKKSNNFTILFLASDPTDASRLRLGKEFQEIQDQLKKARLRNRFKLELPQLSLQATVISQALLDTRPEIVHFSGHGTSEGALCFEGPTGKIHLVQPNALSSLFKEFSQHITCVLLNACYSEIQANAISEHIEYVIGMSKAVGDDAAIAFSVGFYQGLGAGRSIEDAYKLGCAQIQLQGIPEHLTPILFKMGKQFETHS